jgi:hypothetical protein
MINFLGCSAQGIAVANGVAPLAVLKRKRILTRADVRYSGTAAGIGSRDRRSKNGEPEHGIVTAWCAAA